MRANLQPEATRGTVGVHKLTAIPEAARPIQPDRLAAAGIEPALKIDDWARALSCSRREVERLRSSGKLPRPDFFVGSRSPRWHASTARRWLERGGRP
jgi:hypothetical protein